MLHFPQSNVFYFCVDVHHVPRDIFAFYFAVSFVKIFYQIRFSGPYEFPSSSHAY